MADTIQAEFISKFHSLSGITIKERTNNLYNLLNETQHLLQATFHKINLTSLIPTTQLEENFKVTSLVHFKCACELLDVLKSENPILIDLVMKHSSWIIKQAFIDITPEYLATQFFPNISYNVKLKLLNQLSHHLHNSYLADQYFEAIKEHYGYYLASKLLPSCSSNLIIKCVNLYKTEITPGQLLLILKRYPNLTETIFEKLDQQNAKINVGDKYTTVFKHLSKTDVGLFIKLYEKYSPNIRLGPKETESFIKNTYTLSALKTSKRIWKILNTKQIGKSMGSDFNNFYFTIFPKCIQEVKDNLDDCCKLLNFLPNGPARLKMLSTTFQQIYGNELWEYPDFRQEKLLQWMSYNERATWMEHHSKPCGISEETWIAYYKTERSIPLLKEKILSSSNINSRKNYIIALLKTCKLNKDESALLDVLKYINLKHRNDNNAIIQEVISTFYQTYQEQNLTQEHWNEIYQCAQYFILNKGVYFYTPEIVEKCILYHLLHNLPINNILEFWAKQYPGEYNICTKKAQFEKQCLINFEALVPLGYTTEDLSKGYVRYLYCVNNYNNKHNQDKLIINIKDEPLHYIKSSLKDGEYNEDVRGAACTLIMQDCNRCVEDGILELFFIQKFYNHHQIKVMEFLIKENPLLLLNYFQHILKASSYRNFIPKFFRKHCKKLTHLEIPQKVCKLCYDCINDKDENDTNMIKVAIITLSMLATPQEFVTFSLSYCPTELSPDLEGDINQIYYIKRQTIAGHFRNVFPASKTLDGILNFCKGDYLKFAQKSIDVASNSVAENMLLPFLDTLKERAVSVRKHAIFLSCKVSNKIQVNNILLELKQKEKNPSLRKLLFKIAFSKFLNDPSNSSWNLTKELLDSIDCSDGEAFEVVTTCRQVPYEYFDKYLEYSWNAIEICTSSKKTVEDGQLRLLNQASPVTIIALSTKLCTTIIENNLFKCKQLTDLQRGFQSFACRYLIYGPGKEEDRLDTVFTLLKDFTTTDFNNIETIPLAYKLTYNFVTQFCEDIIDKKCTNKAIFKGSLNRWQSLIKPSEMFDEFVYLQLTSVYLSTLSKKLDIGEVGKRIAFICDLLQTENCLRVVYLSNILKPFLSHFYALEFIGKSDENEINLIESIVNNGNSYACLELAVYLLPVVIPIAPIIRKKYDHIINTISKESRPTFKVIFSAYLRSIIIPNV